MLRVATRRLVPLLLCAAASRAGAQDADTTQAAAISCDGRIVRSIEIKPERPPFKGTAAKWRQVARAMGLHHATTKAHVIRAFLALHVGRPCTEFRRAESERVLRAQTFIANAQVRAVPDSSGGVAVFVETTDEIPVIVGGQFSGIRPNALNLGNANVAGEGLRIEAAWERARAFRTGYGGRVVSYATFDRPYVFSIEAYQRRIGYGAAIEMEHPFYTDLQRWSWHAGALTNRYYPHFERPARDALALQIDEDRFGVSALARLFGTEGTVKLLGGGVTGRHVDPGSEGVIVSDSGFVADTGVALRGRYVPFEVTRAGVIFGARRYRYVQVYGFDALTGPQDVPNGVSGALFVARGLPQLGEEDFFLSGATYAGIVHPGMWLANVTEVEGRRDNVTPGWNSIVGSARTALYLGKGPGLMLEVSDEMSGGWRPRLPLQLTLSDRLGGIKAYQSSGVAGERRNVVRTELRYSRRNVIRSADAGVALFSEAGTLVAGDVPYGWSGTRFNAGLSLLAAYPSRSKRMYRVDFAFPFTRGGVGGGKFEIRFGSEDRTTRFWEEPQDVARSRTGEEPSTLFAWPAR